jgi:predicted AlkP superfamily phosphohydrolase/phosphomutase/tetratricopeptide (TPR) repeat protein
MKRVPSSRQIWKPALAVAVLGLALLRWIPEGSFGILQNRVGRSDPVLLAPGIHWRIPGWESVIVYPKKPVDFKDEVTVTSRDRVAVALPCSLRYLPDEERVLRAHRETGAAGAEDWVRHLVRESLERMAARAAGYQLLRKELPRRLAGALEKSLEPMGLVPGSLQVGPGTVAPEVAAEFSAQRLAAMRHPTGRKVVIIGLDGADWDFILPMIQKGQLPNLARLRAEGSYGRIRTNQPPLSPLLWTTVATGKSPDVHGINDFLVLDPKTGQMRPISSDFRKVKAIWNIASDAGLTTEVVAWWATWPAEPIRGIMVSDRVSYSTFSFLAGVSPSQGETFPEGYREEIRGSLRREEDISAADLSQMLAVSQEDLKRALTPRARKGEAGEDAESLATLVRVVASTQNYRYVALDLLRRKQPDLFAVYFQGIDEVNHRYAHLAPSRRPEISPERFRKYSGVVAGFHRYQDRVIGEILQALSPETVVILLSDHGFFSGDQRPKGILPFISEQPGLWHAPFGILVFWGQGVKAGPIPTSTLYDIAPTALDLLGLPPAEDLPGRSLTRVFESHPRESSAPAIVSYEAYGAPRESTPGSESATGGSGSAVGEAMVETLRSLGYVGPAPAANQAEGGAPSAATTALYHSNLAGILAAKGDLEGAEEEYRKALESNPDTASALTGLSRIEERKGRPDEALALLRRMVGKGLHYDKSTFVRMSHLFRQAGREEDGLIYFQKLQGAMPEEPLLDTSMGVLYSALDRQQEAEKAFRRALSLDPLSLPAMEELFVFLDRKGSLESIIPDLQAALKREDDSLMHHNWLGLVYRRQGSLSGAEQELRRAMELGPEQVGIAANLGIVYLQLGRIQEAVDILERALNRDPSSVEVRTNLLVALGRTGNLERAGAVFEEGRKISPEVPGLYNAMAFAYQANGEPEKAVDLLGQSLAMNPSQPEAVELLKRLDPVAAKRFIH